METICEVSEFEKQKMCETGETIIFFFLLWRYQKHLDELLSQKYITSSKALKNGFE